VERERESLNSSGGLDGEKEGRSFLLGSALGMPREVHSPKRERSLDEGRDTRAQEKGETPSDGG